MPSIEPGIRTSVNTMPISSLELKDKDRLIGIMGRDSFKTCILDYLCRHHKEQRFVLYDQDNLVHQILLLLHRAGSKVIGSGELLRFTAIDPKYLISLWFLVGSLSIIYP